jgi:hypothetical protein
VRAYCADPKRYKKLHAEMLNEVFAEMTFSAPKDVEDRKP